MVMDLGRRLHWDDELAVTRHKKEIYVWLRFHFRWVGSVLKEKGHWSEVTARMAKDGVKGIRGTSPYVESVKRVWDFVERDLRAHTTADIHEQHDFEDEDGRGYKLVH